MPFQIPELLAEPKATPQNPCLGFVVDKGMSIPKKENQFCSIIPMNSSEVIVTLKGFHYNLNSRVLKFGETMGVSNYVEEDFGRIIVEKGICAVILSYNV